MNNKNNSTRIGSKDLISTAIFTVLFSICLLILGAIMGMLPVLMPFYAAVGSLPCGIIYIYMRVKTPKKGTIIIQAIITALIYFLMGSIWTFSIGILIGGMIAEFISSLRSYKNFFSNTLGFMIFMCCAWMGLVGPMVLAKEYYIEYTLKSGMKEEYLNTMTSFVSGPIFFVALAATAIGALLGAIFGKKLLKKHFEKAGVL